jgi:hypothetical protein
MSNEKLNSFLQNSWTFYLFSVAMLLVLYFIQKYLFLLDVRWLRVTGSEKVKRKPWPLFVALGIGFSWFLYNTFSPNDISLDFNPQNQIKWIFMVFILICFAGMAFESFSVFGAKRGSIRTIIYTIFIVLYFYAGVITGLFLVFVMALALLIFFFKYFRKNLT